MAHDPDDPERRRDDFRTARIGAAAAVTAAILVEVVTDSLGRDRGIDPVALGILAGTLAALLGVEGLDRMRRGR